MHVAKQRRKMNEKRSPEGLTGFLAGNADETFAFSPAISVAWYSSQAFVSLLFFFPSLSSCSIRAPTVSHKVYLVIRSSRSLWIFIVIFSFVLFQTSAWKRELHNERNRNRETAFENHLIFVSISYDVRF